MNYARLGVCYHPTTTVLIDDNKQFLEITAAELLAENYTSQYYDDPKSALHFLNDIYKSNPFINRCLSNIEESFADHHTIDFDFRKIHHEIYNSQRFNEITSVVADYSMPVLDGLQFCRDIKNESIGKILLTGEAGKELAVDAFNEGTIDKFIMKNAHDAIETLVVSIEKLKIKYFLQLSDLAVRRVGSGVLACLQDLAFVNLIDKICRDNKLFEYYLLDEQGSFLMLDIKGNPYWLIVKNDQEMDSLCHYAMEAEDTSTEVIELLKTRKMVPYFHTDADLQTPPSKWKSYMHLATKLQGNQIYYYAFVKDPKAYHLDTAKIFSYQKYIQHLYR